MIKIGMNMSGVIAGTGIHRYGLELYSRLQELSEIKYSYELFRYEETFGHNTSILRKIKTNIFDNAVLQLKIKYGNIGLLHSIKDIGFPVFLPKISGCRYILTMYDIVPLLFPGYYLSNSIKKTFYEKRLSRCIEIADKIIVISESAKNDIARYFNLKEDKFRVIPLSKSDIFHKIPDDKIEAVIERYSLKQPYILGIGGTEPRKNNFTLIKSYCKLKNNKKTNHKLVIVGMDRSAHEFRCFIKSLGSDFERARENIIFCKFIKDEELAALYSGADCFVFLSLYEGFGIPLLEAMACGVPIIASNTSSIPEVIGEAGIKVNPLDVNQVSDAVVGLISDKELKKSLTMKGYDRIKLFSWEETAKQTLQLYKELLN